MQTMTQQQSLHLDQRYLVVGLGLTGYSVARYLLKRGYQCSVQDDRQPPPYLQQLLQDYPQVEVINRALSEDIASTIDCLVVSPGLSIRSSLMRKVAQSGKRIIGDIELFAEAVTQPVLAITGSNGKSTVTDLLGEMIKADDKAVGVGGNIGVPALDLLDQQPEADFYVLELSSFQLETTSSLKPLAATVLNVSEDHMDRYDDLADYRSCKQSIYTNAAHCISNLDDPMTHYDEQDVQFSIKSDQCEFGLMQQPQTMLAIRGQGLAKVSELKLKGRHNWANCLAAMALAESAGISIGAMKKALQSYTGLAHRSQWVAEINGVNWINDSKATNPGATLAAIEGIDEPIILLAGGQDKGADMRTLCQALKRYVKQVFVFGEDAQLMQQNWQDCTSVDRVDNLQQAVDKAACLSQAGDIVLLSPACASFDQYPGFAARGEHFSELVRKLQP